MEPDHNDVDEAILSLDPTPQRARTLVEVLHEAVQPRLYENEAANMSPAAVHRLAEWYRLPGIEAVARFPILRTLAVDGSTTAAAALAELIVEAPPTDERQAVMALVPLFQPRGDQLPGASQLFPKLLDALAQP